MLKSGMDGRGDVEEKSVQCYRCFYFDNAFNLYFSIRNSNVRRCMRRAVADNDGLCNGVRVKKGISNVISDGWGKGLRC